MIYLKHTRTIYAFTVSKKKEKLNGYICSGVQLELNNFVFVAQYKILCLVLADGWL